MMEEKLFNNLIKQRDDDENLVNCMKEVVGKLLLNETSSNKPGILLGKIQSGKTRAFIGTIALCFDNGYDIAIILTKGTKVLVKQTIQRIERDFENFITHDRVNVFDIMNMPNNLTAYERNQKLVIVVKKEVNNMKRILDKLVNIYPDLKEKKIIMVDDEADYASVSFRKKARNVEFGKISSYINELRRMVNDIDYLEVTATPYSLYLQPNIEENKLEFIPIKPAFTTLLPIHKKYIGGDFYFYENEDKNSVAHYIYKEVSAEERDILKEPDRRKIKIEDVFSSPKISVLRSAVMNFIVGSIILRLKQRKNNEFEKKYAFVAHSEISRSSHKWQYEVITELVKQFNLVAKKDKNLLIDLIKSSYADISVSLKMETDEIPDFDEVYQNTIKALVEEYIMITVVNSDKEIEELLDNQGQLKLRSPMNIYIGGQILDRGITINNLIGFYYGRNPKGFQQDTVLQHSRMYGTRPRIDLAVTRFYTTRDIYEIMKRIHEFDTALRFAFERGEQKNGVYFIRKDVSGKLAPCSPNKLLLSSLTSLSPHKRILPIGFQTGYKSHIGKTIDEIDKIINEWFVSKNLEDVIEVDLNSVIRVVDLIKKTFNFDDNLYQWDWNSFQASIEHLSQNSSETSKRDKVKILVRKDRNLKRIKDDGGYSDAPDTAKTDLEIARQNAIDIPCLMLFRQNGLEDGGWRGAPFYWPVLVAPKNAKTTIFASDTI